MATKMKPDNQNLPRSKSQGRKPRPVPSAEPEANTDGSDRKTNEKKPLPNYLKPTICSRPDPVKFLRKNNVLEDNQKPLLRRRSFDRPPSSLTSLSTSSSQKPLNISPSAHPRERPTVSREKTVTGLRSTSFHGSSRGGLRGSSAVKSPPPVASRGFPGVKKSVLSGSSGSFKSKKEGFENVSKKSSGKEITPESSSVAPAHEDKEEIIKIEAVEQVSEYREEPKQVAQPGEEEAVPMDASTEEDNEELVIEDKTKDQIEEPKEPENTHERNSEEKEEAEKKVDDMKEAGNVEESKEEEGTTETKAQVEELPEERTAKKEVVQGKKESPTAYNDVIASKMQESSTKKKVLALAGAFQTVIDCETAASK